MAGVLEFGRRMAPRRQHDDFAGVGRRRFGGGLDPALQIVDRVDDAAAELRIARPGAVDAVFSSVRMERPTKRAASGVRK